MRTACLRHLLSKQNRSGNDRNRAAVIRLKTPATKNRDSQFDPKSVVNVTTNDFAKIGLVLETTIVSSQMNLSGTVGWTR